ncbi:hypothetical protein [Microcoleus asticus]|uniref:hypothetical protein n=1 Tax=Microcoleus asticus TaxID=2815231 RepID=UPI001555C431|nr:hypothetical protein [Microcoleus asticus]
MTDDQRLNISVEGAVLVAHRVFSLEDRRQRLIPAVERLGVRSRQRHCDRAEKQLHSVLSGERLRF